MQSMSDDDAAYTALLTQLLSDSSSTRNARVHTWIEHQYDFALSEHDATAHPLAHSHSLSHPAAYSRSPSPSPSSSLGAHRTFSLDRPDSPLLPRSSTDRPPSPRSDACPSYDTLFFPPSPNHRPPSEDDELEERERARALKFLVQEMAHWNVHPSTLHKRTDSKPLPAPPPSPATSISTSSRALRSRSSSMRMSRLPSFTSTLSSDQTQSHDVFTPPLPVSVIVHGDPHHELVFRHDHPYPDGYPLLKKDVYPHQEQDARLFPPHDDKDSTFPSPTLSHFSCTYSRETSVTTPPTSFPASPTSSTFAPSCLAENVMFPTSPDVEAFDPLCFQKALPLSPPTVSPLSPGTMVSASSPTAPALPSPLADDGHGSTQLQHLRVITSDIQSVSRWSIATTASLAPSATQVKSGSFLSPRTPSKGSKSQQKETKTPRHRARFASFISRLSPGRSEPSAVNTSGGEQYEYDSGNDSGSEEVREKNKQTKGLSKKSSLASLRASFSLSRASFSIPRPLTSPTEDVPPLPMSPTRTSINPSRPSLTDSTLATASAPSIPRVPSRANLLDVTLPPIPASASTVTTFKNLSQVSLAQPLISPAASTSKISLASPTVTTASSQSGASGKNSGASRTSHLPMPSKRESFQSARTLPTELTPKHPLSRPSLPSSASRGKSLFRFKSSKPKVVKMRAAPNLPVVLPAHTQTGPPQSISRSKLSVPGIPSPQSRPSQVQLVITSGESPSVVASSTSKFVPPSRLMSVGTPALPSYSKSVPSSPPSRSKLPIAPSRITSPSSVSKPSRTIVGMKFPVQAVDVGQAGKAAMEDDVVGTLSKLPLGASQNQRIKVSTVRGLWRKQ